MHHFLSLSNKEYVIVSTVITVHVVGEVGRDWNSVIPHKTNLFIGPLM